MIRRDSFIMHALRMRNVVFYHARYFFITLQCVHDRLAEFCDKDSVDYVM